MKLSNDALKHLTEVKEAAKALQPHHYVWAIDAALSAMRKRVDKQERRVAQHTAFIAEPYVGLGFDYKGEEHTRTTELDGAHKSLVQYRALVVFLAALRRLAQTIDAELWVDGLDFSGFFKSRKGGKGSAK